MVLVVGVEACSGRPSFTGRTDSGALSIGRESGRRCLARPMADNETLLLECWK